MRYAEWKSQQPIGVEVSLAAYIAWRKQQAPTRPAMRRVPGHPVARRNGADAPGDPAAPRRRARAVRVGTSPRPGWLVRVASFVRAVLGPRVSARIAERRLAICRSNYCGQLIAEGGRFHCRACGCPRWRFSELHRKTRYARAACPEGRWRAWDSRRGGGCCGGGS